MKYSIFVIVLLSTFFIAQSQNTPSKEALQSAYTTYFNAERETIHLHFNKNVFINSEPIWFKGYIFDKKNGVPFFNTTNVYVSLNDSDGKEIISKLFFAQNGTFSGSIEINSDFPSGKYLVKAYTNWMNNFQEDESYTSYPIDVLTTNTLINSDREATIEAHDFQFLPEGGHLVDNVNNTIGFKIINCNSMGFECEGQIINSKKEVVANFKSNSMGMGKFDLHHLSNENYTANYTIDNVTYSKTLPKSEPLGFAISVVNYANLSTTYISLKTNETTLQKEANKTYYLVINQNNKVSVLDIEMSNLKTENTIPVPNTSLVSGINTITLFDDQLNPLLERLIFNYDESLFLKSTIFATKIINDSIPITIKTLTKNNQPIATQLSIAILPKESIAYSKKEDIISAFLIAPYIKGHIENPFYYFSDNDRLRKYDLDLLLLTQGWSKYNWDNIKKGTQQITHSFDAGLSIKGIANIPPGEDRQSYTVQMFSITNNLNEIATIDLKNNFYFNNFFLKDEAEINFTVLKNSIKLENIKPFIEIIDNNRKLINRTPQIRPLCNPINNKEKTKSFVSSMTEKNQVLDTVSLSYIKVRQPTKLKHEKSYIANAYSKGIKIDSIARRNYALVLDIIGSHGFVVDDITSANQRTGIGAVRIKNRSPVTFIGSNEPLLIIDDVPLGNNYDILLGMTLDDIDEIFLDPNGNGYGSRGGAGIIRIYRTNSFNNKPIAKKTITNELIIKGGFSVEKEFYVPEFYAISKYDFLNYGVIDWKSNIITDEGGNANFNLFNTNITDAIIFVQGFSADGKLLSEIKELKLIN